MMPEGATREEKLLLATALLAVGLAAFSFTTALISEQIMLSSTVFLVITVGNYIFLLFNIYKAIDRRLTANKSLQALKA